MKDMQKIIDELISQMSEDVREEEVRVMSDLISLSDGGESVICSECKWWRRDTEWVRDEGVHKPLPYGTCQHDKLEYENYPKEDGLAYSDHEGYSASMLTGERFGCIHFEQEGKA